MTCVDPPASEPAEGWGTGGIMPRARVSGQRAGNLRGEVGSRFGLESRQRPADAESLAAAGLGDDVEVHVRDRLVGAGAVVLEHIVFLYPRHSDDRSEEHTSELQSQSNLVCRLLLEKKKKSSMRRTIS